MLNLQQPSVTNSSHIASLGSAPIGRPYGTSEIRPGAPSRYAGEQASSPHRLDYDSAYRLLAPRLERIVARNVVAPGPLIEEACQFAWSRLVAADPAVAPGATLGWLTTTATREAIRARRAQRRELPLIAEHGVGEVIELPAPGPGPDRVVEMREQLAQIHRLPARQRRMLWLQGLGYGYDEIAAQTGDTRRTVERQLLRAKHTLRMGAA